MRLAFSIAVLSFLIWVGSSDLLPSRAGALEPVPPTTEMSDDTAVDTETEKLSDTILPETEGDAEVREFPSLTQISLTQIDESSTVWLFQQSSVLPTLLPPSVIFEQSDFDNRVRSFAFYVPQMGQVLAENVQPNGSSLQVVSLQAGE